MTDYSQYGKEELIARIEELEAQLSPNSLSVSRRDALRGALSAATLGAMGLAATGTVSAAPSGTFPVSTDDPLLILRADRTRYIARTSEPSTPPTGTISVYARDGDLP